MSDSITRYLAYISSVRRYSPRTVEIYGKVLEEFLSFTGSDDPVPSLTAQNIRAYVVYLLDDRHECARTVNLHLSVLSSWCRFLMKTGVLKSNPAGNVTRPRQEKRLPEFYREESMSAWLQEHKGVLEFGSYDSKLKYMTVSLLMATGLRRAELIGLNVGDVDLSRAILKVRGKGDKMREIPLVPDICEEISLYLSGVSSLMEDAYDPGQPLLRTSKGGRLYPMFVERAVKSELGGIPDITGRKSPHVLRHTLATELLDAGTDLNSIKELLGHSSLAATQVYTHNSIERLRKVYESAHPRAKKDGKNGD